jgi:hypothetical protein
MPDRALYQEGIASMLTNAMFFAIVLMLVLLVQ